HCGCVRELVQHAQQRGCHVVGARSWRRHVPPCYLEQVVAFVGGEPQGPRERAEQLLTGLRPPALFQARVVIGRHRRQRCDLLASQTGGAPTWPCCEPDVFGAQSLPPAAEEICQCCAVHATSIRRMTAFGEGSLIPR